MPRYRVGETGLRVITARGVYSLPPGVVLDELPTKYEGKLELIEFKEVNGYSDKSIRAGRDIEDKSGA